MVSFILPAYKRKFLKESIASILAQTYLDFELVVIDDGSPENLKEVVDEFSDVRLSYHRNAENIGGRNLVQAWNHAMEYAHGEWCILASDDDVWMPKCLERLMALAEKYPECDLFHARCAYIDSDGKWMDISPQRLEFESQIQHVYERGVLRSFQQAPDFMFRKSAYDRIGGFVNFPLAWHSDDATWMLLAKNGCAHTSEAVFCFRRSGINLSASSDRLLGRKLTASFSFLKWAREFIRRMEPRTEEERFLMSIMADGIDKSVKGLMAWEMAEAKSFRIWLQAFRRDEFSSLDKRNVIYKRYPLILALRNVFSS